MPRDLFVENGILPGAQNSGPVDLFQKNNINPYPSPQQSQSFIDQMANSPLINGVLGAGDALASTLSAGLVNPRTGSGTAYDVGRAAGNIGGFVGGGEALDAARASTEALPMIGQVAKMLGGDGWSGLARRALGTGAYGALTNPDNRAAGFAEGATLSGVADKVIPGAFSMGAKLVNTIRPQKYAEQVVDQLGSGKTLEDNAKSLAQDIKNSYQNRVQEGNALYNSLDNLYSRSLYNGVKPADSAYQSLGKDITSDYGDRNLEKLHQKFTDAPTFQNAHDLQSQLGSAIRKLQGQDAKGSLSVADRKTMQGYQEAQDALRGDINSFLNRQGPLAAAQYQHATQNWLDNVVPYIENNKIAPIAKGDVTNPRNITNIFQKPEPAIQKIMEDLGPQAANKVLYAELGKYQSTVTPENLLSALQKLDEKGLGSYVSPKLAQQTEALAGRISNRNMVQRGAGALLGASAIHPFVHNMPVDIMAALGAGAFSPATMRYLQSRLPVAAAANAVARGAQAFYPPMTKALLANAIPGGQ